MAIITFEELFVRAAAFEERLERYYAQIRDTSEDNGVRLLTYYLCKHRRHLQSALDEFEDDVVARIKQIRLKYDIDFRPERDFHIIETPAEEVKAAELLEAAIDYDEELVKLYKGILSQPVNEEARSLIEALIRVEEKDIVMLKKTKAMNYF